MTLVLSGTNGISAVDGSAATPAIQGTDTNTGVFFPAADTVAIATGGSERARIDSSGNLLVGTTGTIGGYFPGKLQLAAGDTNGLVVQTTTTASNAGVNIWNATDAGTRGLINFYTNTSRALKGSISSDGSTVAYNTSSDYRLKEAVQPMQGALAKVALLKPCTYKWKADGSDGEGFIAHELAEVVPDAVTGKKDAVDAEGNPVYQGIDTSFLVATLTAAIQEQQALIESLTARIAALEAA